MNEFSIETSCMLHRQFYMPNFAATKCGSAYGLMKNSHALSGILLFQILYSTPKNM